MTTRNDGRQRPIPWRNRFEADDDDPPRPPRFLSESSRRTPGAGRTLRQLTPSEEEIDR